MEELQASFNLTDSTLGETQAKLSEKEAAFTRLEAALQNNTKELQVSQLSSTFFIACLMAGFIRILC